MDRPLVATLVTEALAEIGVKFRVVTHPKCSTCKLFRICVGTLRPGFEYEVVEVRSTKHTCPLTGAVMRVVRARPLPAKVAVLQRTAVEGIIVRYEPLDCDERNCSYWRFCVDTPIRRQERVRIERIVGILNCPRGLRLSLVEVYPLSLLPSARTRSGRRRRGL